MGSSLAIARSSLTTSSEDGSGSRRETTATSAPAERLKRAARLRSEVPVTL